MYSVKYPLALGNIVYHTLISMEAEVSICWNHERSLPPNIAAPRMPSH